MINILDNYGVSTIYLLCQPRFEKVFLLRPVHHRRFIPKIFFLERTAPKATASGSSRPDGEMASREISWGDGKGSLEAMPSCKDAVPSLMVSKGIPNKGLQERWLFR